MPFQVSASDTRYPHPELIVSGFTTFTVASEFVYLHDNAQITIRPGFSTNFASVPPVLWGLISSYGRQTLPAIMHDQLCTDAREEPTTALAYAARSHADDLFRHALRDQGMAVFRRNIFWAGVVLGRLWEFAKVRLAIVTVLLVLYSTAFYTGLSLLASRHGSPGWALLLVLVPIVGSVLWQPEALSRLFLIATYVGVPVAALAAVGLVVQLWVRAIPDRVQWLASRLVPGINGPPGGIFTPTDVLRM